MRPFAINDGRQTVDVNRENTSTIKRLSNHSEIIRTAACRLTVEIATVSIDGEQVGGRMARISPLFCWIGCDTKLRIDGGRVRLYVNPHKCVTEREW